MSLNHFIEANGTTVTHRKLVTAVYNEYDELDESSSTWLDIEIKVLIQPITRKTMERLPEGLRATPQDLEAYIPSDIAISEGEYIIYNGTTYRIISLEKSVYAGTTLQKTILHRLEP